MNFRVYIMAIATVAVGLVELPHRCGPLYR